MSVQLVREAGVIGAGGAGFPTYAKLDARAEYILLNGAECEPLLRVDQQLMELYPEMIIEGFEAARKMVGANKGIIGIKNKHKEVICLLENKIKELNYVDVLEVKILKDIYPAGDEQVLVYELTKRVVPEAGIPLQVGCVVINSETALNIYNALNNEAVTEKYITVTGDVPNKITVKVPVGTPIIDVLKLSGIEDFENYRVIDGGPMMGNILESLDGYVTKKNKGFIILKSTHSLIKKKSATMEQTRKINRASCEQCRMCTDMCPRYLLGHNTKPHMMMRALGYKLDDYQGQINSYLCCQCNLCELFACPAGLYPKASNVYFKQKLTEQNIRYTRVSDNFEPRAMREYRLIPSKRLVARLGLRDFDKPAPIAEHSINPSIVYIALQQHVGAPSFPTVLVGDYVTKGQLIGEIPESKLGANVHSSISGTVIEISNNFIGIRRA